jgi:hypothetical protein
MQKNPLEIIKLFFVVKEKIFNHFFAFFCRAVKNVEATRKLSSTEKILINRDRVDDG